MASSHRCYALVSALAVVILPSAALAATPVSGTWAVEICLDSGFCEQDTWDIEQRGATLEVFSGGDTPSYTGTIDLGTGAMSLTSTEIFRDCGLLTFSGTATDSPRRFSGTFQSWVEIGTMGCTPVSLALEALPADDGTCDPTPRDGCRAPLLPKSTLMLHDLPGGTKDKLVWKWTAGAATSGADFADPTAGMPYAVCMYDESDGVIFRAVVPPAGTCGTKPCWKGLGSPAGSKGYRYKEASGSADGIASVLLAAGPDGKAKVIVAGKGTALSDRPLGLPDLPLPSPPTVRVQLQQVGDAACWEARYTPDEISVNVPTFLRAKGGQP